MWPSVRFEDSTSAGNGGFSLRSRSILPTDTEYREGFNVLLRLCFPSDARLWNHRERKQRLQVGIIYTMALSFTH